MRLMSACIDIGLPDISCGYFIPISDRNYSDKGFATLSSPLLDEPLVIKTRGYYNARYYMNSVGQIIRNTGGLLLQRHGSKRRKYCHYHSMGVEIHATHPLFGRLNEFPIRYIYHYARHKWHDENYHRLAIHFFGEPKDRRYNEYMLVEPKAFSEYEKCFITIP